MSKTTRDRKRERESERWIARVWQCMKDSPHSCRLSSCTPPGTDYTVIHREAACKNMNSMTVSWVPADSRFPLGGKYSTETRDGGISAGYSNLDADIIGQLRRVSQNMSEMSEMSRQAFRRHRHMTHDEKTRPTLGRDEMLESGRYGWADVMVWSRQNISEERRWSLQHLGETRRHSIVTGCIHNHWHSLVVVGHKHKY